MPPRNQRIARRIEEEGLVRLLVPERDVEVPGRARPFCIGLGHERQAVAVEPGDLLGAVLEQDASVRRLHDLVVADVDFVLARRGFALAELDRDSGHRHLVANLPVQRLELGGLEKVVVLVVIADPLDVLVALLAQVLICIREHVELELGARLDGISESGRSLNLSLQHRPRRNRNLGTSVVGRVA
jgi:hypothetical protein